jgi:hypothetical protein
MFVVKLAKTKSWGPVPRHHPRQGHHNRGSGTVVHVRKTIEMQWNSNLFNAEMLAGRMKLFQSAFWRHE